ncbi:MAG: metal-dependent transcriptional regulator [Clostridiales bacterium]|nr:metal-dependent transcriptional regulator [Clostridiales bacterium]
MALKESGEMYLETILILSKQKDIVRSVDVAEYMNFSKPSVSRAIGILKSNGYVIMADNGNLSLTDKGLNVAEKIFARHRIITALLTNLGVEESVAAADACRMEHVVSDETFEALIRLNDKLELFQEKRH